MNEAQNVVWKCAGFLKGPEHGIELLERFRPGKYMATPSTAERINHLVGWGNLSPRSQGNALYATQETADRYMDDPSQVNSALSRAVDAWDALDYEEATDASLAAMRGGDQARSAVYKALTEMGVEPREAARLISGR